MFDSICNFVLKFICCCRKNNIHDCDYESDISDRYYLQETFINA